jgi:hypothetical protein
MSIYSVITLSILIIVISISRKDNKVVLSQTETEDSVVSTEYIYVKNDLTTNSTSAAIESADEEYTVRAYMQKIGIFSKDGTLLRVLEVYIKTLPEADRRLLEEGIAVIGKKQLNSIIEDYTG